MVPENGAERAALSALRAHGGGAVYLRMPAQAVGGSDAEQLGLTSPGVTDLLLEPAVARRDGATLAVLVYAGALAELAGSRDAAAARAIFQQALGVVVSGEVYAVKGVEPMLVHGMAYAYRVSLERITAS